MLLFTVAYYCDFIFSHTYQQISYTKLLPLGISMHKYNMQTH